MREGLVKVSFCSRLVNELEVITADFFYQFAFFAMYVALAYVSTNTDHIESFKKIF